MGTGQRQFKLKLCYPDGKALVFAGDSSFERDIVSTIADEVLKTAVTPLVASIVLHGVGYFRSEAHVADVVKKTLAIHLPALVESAVKTALLDLKTESLKAL
jgi:hypothetical protein